MSMHAAKKNLALSYYVFAISALATSCGITSKSSVEADAQVSTISAEQIIQAASANELARAADALADLSFSSLAENASASVGKTLIIDDNTFELTEIKQRSAQRMAAKLDHKYGSIRNYWDAIGFDPRHHPSAAALSATFKRVALLNEKHGANLLDDAPVYTATQCAQSHTDLQNCQVTYVSGRERNDSGLVAQGNTCVENTREAAINGNCNAEKGCINGDASCKPASNVIMNSRCPANNVCFNGGYIESVNGKPGPGLVGYRQIAIAPDQSTTTTTFSGGGKTSSVTARPGSGT